MSGAAQLRLNQDPAPHYPPQDEVARVWSVSTPITESNEGRAWLASRGIEEPASVFEAVRVLPEAGWLPGWAHMRRRQGMTLIFPARDHAGELRSLRFRSMEPGTKAKPPQGYDIKGLVLSLGMTPPTCRELVIVEGEPDWLTWISRGVTCIGITNGSWRDARHQREHALRIQTGCHVYLRTDCNGAGDRYAHDIAQTLQHARLYRLEGRGPKEDDNDHLVAGTLEDDPGASCRRIAAPPRKRPPRRSPNTPPARGGKKKEDEEVSPYAQTALEAECAAMRRASAGDRNHQLNRSAYSLGQLVGGGELPEATVRQALYAAAKAAGLKRSEILGDRGRGGTLQSGLREGMKKPRKAPAPSFGTPEMPSDATAPVDQADAVEETKRTLEDGRLELPERIVDALYRNGRTMIKGPCGIGKTYAAARKVCERLTEDRGSAQIAGGVWPGDEAWSDPGVILGKRSGVVAVPSRDNVEEQLGVYRAVAEPLGLSVAATPARSEKNCERFGCVALANRHHPEGGKLFCMGCPKNVRNSPGGVTDCPFMVEMLTFEGADIQVTTHALELQRTPLEGDRVFFEWGAFDSAAVTGMRCVPWVVRTAGGYRVGVRADDAGAPVPPPEHTEYRTWTADAKHALLDWIADALGIAPDWQDLREWIQGDSPKERAFVDWSKIAEHKGSRKLFKPVREYDEAGWHKGWHLRVEEAAPGDARGAWLPHIAFTPARQRTEESKGDVYDWLRRAWRRAEACGADAGGCDIAAPTCGDDKGAALGVSCDGISSAGAICKGDDKACETWDAENPSWLDDLEAMAKRHIDQWPVDVLVVDESLWPSMRKQGTLSIADLAEVAAAEDIEGDITPLTRAMHKTSRAKEPKDRRIDGAELGAILQACAPPKPEHQVEDAEPPKLRVKGFGLGERTVREASRMGEERARFAALQGGVDWVGLAGLERAIALDGRTAYIKDGLLHTTEVTPPTFDHARCVIGLDATTTPTIARTVFGKDVRYEEVEVDLPDALERVWIPYSTSKSSRIAGDQEKPTGKRAAAVMLSTVLRYGADEGALNITHMDWLAGGWIKDLAEHEAAAADWIYHGSGESRGSNAYRDAHTVRGDAYHVPRQAVAADAELLAELLSVNPSGEALEALKGEAQWQIEGAELEQRYGRVRPLEASEERPKRMVFCDERDPAGLGLPATEVVDPDVLAWEVCGYVSHRVMDLVARAVIERAGGVFCPTIDMDGPSPLRLDDLRAAPGRHVLKRFLEGRPYNSTDEVPDTTSQIVGKRLCHWVSKHFGGDWQRAADAWGLNLAEMTTDRGGDATPILYADALEETHVDLWARVRGAKSYSLDGGEKRHLPEADSPLHTALLRIEAQPVKVGETLDAIGDLTGKTGRTAREWVDELRRDGETVIACLRRLWAEIQAFATLEKIAEREAILALNMDADEARAIAVAGVAESRPQWVPWRVVMSVSPPVKEARQKGLWG